MLLLVLLALAKAGFISPATTKPILLQYNNANAYSDMTFSFQIESRTPIGSVLRVTFPPTSYDANLGLATAPDCTAYNKANILLPC